MSRDKSYQFGCEVAKLRYFSPVLERTLPSVWRLDYLTGVDRTKRNFFLSQPKAVALMTESNSTSTRREKRVDRPFFLGWPSLPLLPSSISSYGPLAFQFATLSAGLINRMQPSTAAFSF